MGYQILNLAFCLNDFICINILVETILINYMGINKLVENILFSFMGIN